jgi:ABC-2 type transport system ATP-binding protein
LIQLENLSKTFQVHQRASGLGASLRSLFSRKITEVQAVRELTFSIEEGERVGFLGPNGAGKTTTLKMLSGLLWPTSGGVQVLGFEPRKRPRELLRQITLVMGQKQQLIWDLPPSDTFDLNCAVYDLDRRAFRETVDELVALLDLGGLVSKPSRQLSLGERMRCELAAALLHRPRVLFLDEPTIGLDVTMQAIMRSFIDTYAARHKATVLLTSHYMDDVKALCPRVLLIDKGALQYDGDLEGLVRRTVKDKRVTVHLHHEVPAETLERLGTIVERSTVVAVYRAEAARVSETVQRVLAELPVADLRVEDPPLSEVMAQIFRGGPEGQG